MRPLLLATLFFFSKACVAQTSVIDVSKSNFVPQNAFYSVGGTPFVNVKFVNLVSGTPYFKEEWLKGTGVSSTGGMYKAGILKLDLVDNQVHFLDAGSREMIATSSLKELTLSDTIANTSWHFVHSSSFPATTTAPARQGWYLQLAKGNASVYQFFLKLLSERIPYGSATTEQSIITKEEFYLLHNGTLQQIKKAKEIIAILGSKEATLETVYKENKNGTMAEQLTALAEAYNKP